MAYFLKPRPDPDLAKLRGMLMRLHDPLWMATPDRWMWLRPDGVAQGFTPIIDKVPGLANLLWLTMDMDQPPARYDSNANPAYMQILLSARSARLRQEPLIEVAGIVTLQEFSKLLPPATMSSHPVEAMYPLLRVFAMRRLAYAGN